MTFKKRLRVMWAAAFQTWHQKQCGECRTRFWVEGPDYEFIAICDACEAKLLDTMASDLERQWQQRALRGVQE